MFNKYLPIRFLCLYCLLIAPPGIAEESTDESELESGFGFLLIRLVGKVDERAGIVEMTDLNTKESIIIRSDSCKWSRPTAGICLVTAPAGSYFLSAYQPEYHFGFWRLDDTRWDIRSPHTSDDVLEIVPAVINYAGDWTIEPSQQMMAKVQMSIDVDFSAKTLENVVVLYPEYANQYEIYLSMRGRRAVSLADFQKIIEENSTPQTPGESSK